MQELKAAKRERHISIFTMRNVIVTFVCMWGEGLES